MPRPLQRTDADANARIGSRPENSPLPGGTATLPANADLGTHPLEREARRQGLQAAARLNGSSDLAWEELHPEIFQRFPNIHFFDYTKNPARMNRYLQGSNWPTNYHLTFSAQPNNHELSQRVLEQGGTVAAVFWPEVPQSFWGYPVINGDDHDARFFDKAGTIVGLRRKVPRNPTSQDSSSGTRSRYQSAANSSPWRPSRLCGIAGPPATAIAIQADALCRPSGRYATEDWNRVITPANSNQRRNICRRTYRPVLSLAIWQCCRGSVGKQQPVLAISTTRLSRIYKDGNQWGDSDSFEDRDLPNLAKAAADVHTWIFQQKATAVTVNGKRRRVAESRVSDQKLIMLPTDRTASGSV